MTWQPGSEQAPASECSVCFCCHSTMPSYIQCSELQGTDSPDVPGSSNGSEKSKKPQVNSYGYHNGPVHPRQAVDNFYHRLLQSHNDDSLNDALIHNSFLHPALCQEWVQHYRVSLDSGPSLVHLPSSALIELALSAFHKTILLQHGSLNQCLEPCKQYSCILLHSIWVSPKLLPVKARPSPPYAPQIWTIVEKFRRNSSIEAYGRDDSGVKTLALLCEGNIIVDNEDFRGIKSHAMTTDLEKCDEDESPHSLPSANVLFRDLSTLFLANASCPKKSFEFSPLNEGGLNYRISYGTCFKLPLRWYSFQDYQSSDFMLVADLEIESIKFMNKHYMLSPPVMEAMLHQVVTAYFCTEVAPHRKVLMYPRMFAIEAFYINFSELKNWKLQESCCVMVTSTKSKNHHLYSEGSPASTEDWFVNEMCLDCTLLTPHGDVVAHARNVLYRYSEMSFSLPRLSKSVDISQSTSGRRVNSNLRERNHEDFVASSTIWTNEAIGHEIKKIASMFLDFDGQDVIPLDTPLVECGLDSLASTEFIELLNTKFKLTLPPTLLVHSPSISDIHEHLSNILLSCGEAETKAEASCETSPYENSDIDENATSNDSSESSHISSKHEEEKIVPVDIPDLNSEEPHLDHITSPMQLRSRLSMNEHENGNTVFGNEWFSVFYSCKEALPRYRLILCPGQVQGTAPWISFAETLNSAGIDVYVVRIPGQFERGSEPPYEGTYEDIVLELCNALEALGCLEGALDSPLNEDSSQELICPSIPLAMFGFSLGTCFAVGMTQRLQALGVKVSHITSLCGLTVDRMKTLESSPEPYTPPRLIATLVEFFGRAPDGLLQYLDSADEEGIRTVMRYFDEGFRFAREWVYDMDSRKKNVEPMGDMKYVMNVDFLRIIASDDISCPRSDETWKVWTISDVATANNFFIQDVVYGDSVMESIIYPGDHYFHVESIEAEKSVSNDVVKCLLRRLGEFQTVE